MCGRYALHAKKEQLAEAIAQAIPDSYEPDYNISPGREVLCLSTTKQGGRVSRMHWGLRTPQNFHINARIETADTSPRFRESWENFRCLVPASGFYEWYADGISKRPYYISAPGRDVLLMAGLWYPSSGPSQPDACLILTTESSESIRPIHDRMPLILDDGAREDWLSNNLPKQDAVRIANAIEFSKHPVSQRVNRVQNNDHTLINPSSGLSDEQLTLFQ